LAIQDVFRRSGAVDEVEGEIARLVAEAEAAIAAAPITDPARVLLGGLAAYVAWRDR